MKIPFGESWRGRYQALMNEVFESGFWSEGQMLKRLEAAFGDYVRLPARAVNSGGAALLSIFDYLNLQGGDVIVPANTFRATALAARRAGGNVIYADCNREDLCLSLDDLKRKITRNTKAVCVVHIGGHIAFQIEEIAEYCRAHDIALVEDCAHVHGGWWNGKTGGHYGFAGAYSFYATKTMPVGEGGMVVSKDEAFLQWLEKYRNYGKEVIDGKVTYAMKEGFNYRMNEATAALGLLQLERLPEVLEWKRVLAAKYDEIFENRVQLPDGMTSGYYKYIVFGYDALQQRTGQVFGPADLGPAIDGIGATEADTPNSDWIAQNHQCVPIWFGWDEGGADIGELKKVLL